MAESQQKHTKFDSNQKKYLILNPTGVLDAIVTSRIRTEDDLVLRQCEEGVFSILKDGKRIAEHLNRLTTEYGYSMVLYSNRREQQIFRAFRELDEALKQISMKGLPKTTAMIVKDREVYPQVRANDLRVAENCLQETLIAGYGLQSPQETEILDGCAKLLHFSKLDHNSYVVLDVRPAFVEKANQEGWNAWDATSTSLQKIFSIFSQNTHATKSPNRQKHTKEHLEEEKHLKEEPRNEVRNKKITPNKHDLSFSGDFQYNNHRNSQKELENQEKQRKLVEKEVDMGNNKPEVAQTNDKDNLDAGPYTLDDEENKSQNEADNETKKPIEVNMTGCEECGAYKLAEIIDWLPDDLSTSSLKFNVVVEGDPPRGSSPSLRWFIEDPTNSKWVGKCSTLALQKKDSFYEYKEFLGSLIYKLFGVRTPSIVFSEQLLDAKFKQNNIFQAKDLDEPRLHLMSIVIPGFELLGDKFIKDYKIASKRNENQPFYMHGGSKPLRGFGRAVAVSILIHDYDFIGNSGKNIGCIPSEDGEYFEILKIDPGESLSFAEDMSGVKSLHNPPSTREAVCGTCIGRISFDDLNKFDKEECIETLKTILEMKNSTLEKLFTPFLRMDHSKFGIIFEELLNRKKELLNAFYEEVKNFIDRHLHRLEEQLAAEHMSRWGKPPLPMHLERQKKDQLIRDKAQLEAFVAASHANSTDKRILQTSSHAKEKFIGRDTELSQVKELFCGNSRILGCAIVGAAGLGKSQLATEYVIRNQKEMYSEVVWLHAEQSELIIDQIQIYLETCHNIKFDIKEKEKKASIVTTFYQILGKKGR